MVNIKVVNRLLNERKNSRKSPGMAKRGDECTTSFKKVSWDGKKGGKIVLVNVEIVNEMAKRGNECL